MKQTVAEPRGPEEPIYFDVFINREEEGAIRALCLRCGQRKVILEMDGKTTVAEWYRHLLLHLYDVHEEGDAIVSVTLSFS